MLEKTIVDLSKPKGHPQRKRRVQLSPDEESRVRAEWATNAQRAQEQVARAAEREEMHALREKLLDARAVGAQPAQADIDRFEELRMRVSDD